MAKKSKKAVEKAETAAVEAAPEQEAKPKAKAKAKPKAKAKAGAKAPKAAGPRKGPSLVVVESPAKERTISRFLKNDFIVRSSYGHVRDLPLRKIGVDVDDSFAPQ